MEKCPHCDALIKENKQLRKERAAEHKEYVEVVNENLALHRLVIDYDRRLSAITLNRLLNDQERWEDEGGK